MKYFSKSLIALGLAAGMATPMAVTPAAAQTAAAPVKGIGIVSLPAVVQNSSAFKTAEQQREVTYKAQIDQATTRRDQIAAQLKPLVDKFNADQKANPNNPALAKEAQTIQQINESGKQELQRIMQPIALSRAYVTEQIEDKLDDAVKAAAQAKGVSLILDASQGAVVYAEGAYNITADVLSSLNSMLPTAQLVPPQGWVPREVRQQQEQQAQAQAAATAAQNQPQASGGR
ncbi:OmpH family outer membrane protein [Tsuneonella mangrovi]|uniref:OmpH family outer membrane protein n=1 Tax=Tsuneonella mangrovi TaxID=1982042 RepID=UPI000BA2776A|nr:OmpH family outer membrane protein [Tsuneonella mangrovi]